MKFSGAQAIGTTGSKWGKCRQAIRAGLKRGGSGFA